MEGYDMPYIILLCNIYTKDFRKLIDFIFTFENVYTESLMWLKFFLLTLHLNWLSGKN